MLKSLGPALQIGVVTNDLQQSVREWVTSTHVAPFAVLPEALVACIDAQGCRTELPVAVALGFHADLMIELIQPLDDRDSFYRERLKRGPHVHHFGFWPHDMERALAECEAHGWHLRARVEVKGRPPTSFFEFPPMPSILIELIEGGSEKLASYQPIRDRARAWQRRSVGQSQSPTFAFQPEGTIAPA